MASWATRIPQVRDGLGLTRPELGLVLLAIAAGSIVSLVLAGQIVARFGSRRTVAAMAVLLARRAERVSALGYPRRRRRRWWSGCSSSASRTAPGTWR